MSDASYNSVQGESSVLTERVNMLYQQVPFSGYGALAAAWGVAWYLWGVLPQQLVTVWIALICLFVLPSLILRPRYFRTRHSEHVRNRYAAVIGVQAVLMGAMWGMLGPVAWEYGSEPVMTFVVLVQVGIAAATIMALGSVIPFYMLFSALTVLPSAYVMAAMGVDEHWFFLGGLAGIYVPILWVAALGYNKSLKESFALRYQNLELITSLTNEQVRTNETVTQLKKEVAQRKEMEQELIEAISQAENANFAKSRFLANMSHEIRTPLTSIVGYAEMLFEGTKADPEKRNSVDIILRNSEHLMRIINEILDLSKIEENRLEIECLPMNLIEVVNEVVASFRPILDEKGLLFDLQYHFPVPEKIVSDPTRVHQILYNLLGNALKFTEAGSINLHLYYLQSAKLIKIVICDTGIGMTRLQIRKLFQPFTQADVSTTRKYGGTGLGLTISRKLARLLGGDIVVESVVDQGSEFTVTLSAGEVADLTMLSQLPEQYSNEDSLSLKPGTCFAGKVLVAEDTADIRKLIGIYLEAVGIKARFVENGHAAVEAAMNEKFDLIFMDMQMPVMGGHEAIQELRRRGYTGDIYALTANAMHKEVNEYLSSGATGFVAKPVDRACLYGVLQKHLPEVELTGEEKPGHEDDANRYLALATEAGVDIQELVQQFAERLPGDVEIIRELLQANNLVALTNLVHNLKGMGGAFGHPRVTELCIEMETALKNSDIVKVEAVYQHLLGYVLELSHRKRDGRDAGS